MNKSRSKIILLGIILFAIIPITDQIIQLGIETSSKDQNPELYLSETSSGLLSINDIVETNYENLTFNQNESFTLELGEIMTFHQCIVPEDHNIAFSGNGTLNILNSDFYHLLISGNLKVIITSSIVAFTEITGQSEAIYQYVILEQFYASDNTSNIFINCGLSQLYDNSPIPGAITSGTMIKAGGFSRIIMAPYANTGLWGRSPAGIIWNIDASTYDETNSLVSLTGIVDMEFYIEGFNPHPPTNSKNISIHFFVGEILEETILCTSNAENWSWQVNYQFNTSKYSNGKYWLKVVINDSIVENRIIFPFLINNLDHIISEPTVVFPNGGETLSGDVTIQWLPTTDSLYHSITYSLMYSSNAGKNWISITSGLTAAYYVWNTHTVDNGTDYLIRVIAICSSGLTGDDISNDVFTIIHGQTTAAPTSLTSTDPTSTITPSFTIVSFLISILVNLAVLKRLRTLKSRSQ